MLENLQRLSVGDRFWFWMCPEAVGDTPALILQPLAEDPGMKMLDEQADQLSIPLTAAPFMGLGNVNSEGRFHFSGPLASATHLTALAGWVKQHPELARLKDSILINVSTAGIVRAIHQDPTLWEGIPDAVVPGTLAETAMRIKRIRPGRPCWFWLAQNGPGDKPFLALYSTKNDPDGAAFAKAVTTLRRQTTRRGTEIRGLLQTTENGSVVMTTDNPIDPAQALLQAVAARHPALREPLSALIVMRTERGKVAQVVTNRTGEHLSTDAAQRADLEDLTEVLQTLSAEGSKVLFWFGIAAEDGTPHLRLAQDRGVLRDAARDVGKTRKSTRGEVVVSRKGWLEFKTRIQYAEFVAELADWTRPHRKQWPALKKLRGARMTCRNADGDIVDRQKNDDAWKASA